MQKTSLKINGKLPTNKYSIGNEGDMMNLIMNVEVTDMAIDSVSSVTINGIANYNPYGSSPLSLTCNL